MGGVAVTGQHKLLQTAFLRPPHSLGPGVLFLRGAQFLPGGEPKEDGLKVFNFWNLHSWNEDLAQLRSNSTSDTHAGGRFSRKERFCSGAAVLMLSQLVGWVPAS